MGAGDDVWVLLSKVWSELRVMRLQHAEYRQFVLLSDHITYDLQQAHYSSMNGGSKATSRTCVHEQVTLAPAGVSVTHA